jgi:predicted RNA-binding Zn-ribbon protein involved in translation (DUF1610 family)
MESTIISCPICGGIIESWSGACEDCGVVIDDEKATAEACPKCGNNVIFDIEAGVCYGCGYESPPTDLYCDKPPYEPILDAQDASRDVFEAMGPYTITKWAEDALWASQAHGFPIYPYEPPPPYQPFFDLIEELHAKWRITVLKTQESRWNKWISKVFGRLHGQNVTDVPKAVFNHIYIPEHQWGTKQGYITLCHEATHAKDFYRFGIIPFMLMGWLLPFGPSLVALLEYRAYVAGLKAEKEVYGSLLPGTTERIAKMLASRGYKYCWPWPKLMQRWLDRAIA